MALILSFPIHKTSIPKKVLAREEQQLLRFPVKPSISEKHPDLDGQIFELEMEKVRAKCALQLPAEKAENNPSIRDRLALSLGKRWGFFVSSTIR